VSFTSILFDGSGGLPSEATDVPDYFADLHLDDIVRSVTSGREAYDLAPFFHAPLKRVEAIAYRHEVFRDLEDEATLGIVRAFARQMQAMRDDLAHIAKAHYQYERERWFLDAAEVYADAIRELARDLAGAKVRSRGLSAFRDHLASYAASDPFTTLATDTQRVREALANVRYRLRINGGRVTVSQYEPEPDYGAEILEAFEKFKQGAGKEYRFEFSAWPELNHVEAAVLERVAWLNPAIFASLDEFCRHHRDFIGPTIARFDREIQFYVAYLEHVARMRRAGLPFCYPDVSDGSTAVHGRDVFDLALAASFGSDAARVVTNDVELHGPERIAVISGPNQGGKTTFARTIGQLHHLARIGVLVPGTEVRAHLVDRIFTHFERQEEVEDHTSKLETDLLRIKRILEQATPDGLLIMNESFTSTTLGDQLFIGKRVMRAIIERGLLCVAVTFLDELASLDASTASMVSAVDPDEPARRTFKIVRRPADGLAYAMAIAEKHRVTYAGVEARLAR
jgi:DNA mismatch repair protein MutS